MKSVYRKAKKFKLDENLEVNDEFTGTAKQPVKRSWDYYDRRKGLWYKFPSIYRFLHTAVGSNWDNVFSKLIGRTKRLSPLEADFVRERIRNSVVTKAVIVDSVPYEYSRWTGLRPLSGGDYYVGSGILKCVPMAKRKRCHYRGNYLPSSIYNNHGGKECETFGDINFFLHSVEYKRRIAAGVFSEVVEKVWLKSVPYQYTYQASRYERDEFGWRKTVFYTETAYAQKITTASKKEIRDYGLNATNNKGENKC